MSDLAVTVDLKGRDNLSRPLGLAGQSLGGLKDNLSAAASGLKSLQQVSGQVDAFRHLKRIANDNAASLKQTEDKTKRLGAEMVAAKAHAASYTDKITDARAALDQLRAADVIDRAAVKAAKDGLAALSKEARQAASAANKLEREFESSRKTLDRQRAVAEADTNALRQMRSGLDAAGIKTRSLAADSLKLKAQIELQTIAVKKAHDEAAAGAAKEAAALAKLKQDKQRAHDEAAAAAAKEAAALAKLRQHQQLVSAAQNRRNGLQNVGSGLRGVGMTAAAMGAGAGLAALPGLKQGIDFEKQMSVVAAVADLDTKAVDAGDQRISKSTFGDFKRLEELALRLGSTTQFSAAQAAEGMQYLAMSGFNTGQIMAALPGVLDLAKAANMDLGETADIAANMLNGFGLEADQMGRVGDVLTNTFNKSNTDLKDLGDTMKYVAPVARQLGSSIEDTAAMAGLLGNVGIKGSEAGTALRAMHTRLAAPPKEAADALKDLGIKTKDAKGNLLPMAQILGDVAKKTEKMGTADRAGAFKALAGEEAGAALSELVAQQGAAGITKFTDVLKDSQGATKRVAAIMSDNTAGDIDNFTSALEGLNITLFKTNSAPLRDLIRSATDMVTGIDAWVKANPELAATLVKVGAATAALAVVGGGLTAVIGSLLGPFAMLRYGLTMVGLSGGMGATVLRGFGSVASVAFRGVGMLASGLPLLIRGFGLVGTALRVLSLALVTNPIGLIVTGIAVAAGLIYYYWEPLSGLFRRIFGDISFDLNGLWTLVKTVFSFSPVGLMVQGWGLLGGFVRDILQGIGLDIDGWIDGILSKFSGLADKAKALAQSLMFWSDDDAGASSAGTGSAGTGGLVDVAKSSGIPLSDSVDAAARFSPSAAAARVQTASAAAPVSVSVNVTINGSTAADTRELVAMIRREVEAATRSAVRSGSAAYDDGVH